jgi:dTDP-4-amino-4,6-dideoxygalactose transaminase
MKRFFGDRKITLYASGTAALAQAMANCASRASTGNPEVIIPAYGCPDLVAACVYARVYPRLTDVSACHWSYDPESLDASLSPDTVAIVTVNLLGLGDGSAQLTRLCKDKQISLIQDSAQYLPRQSGGWPGDYVVLSFGRGKPLNLLRGGALTSLPGDGESVTIGPVDRTTRARLLSSRAAAVAFNVLTRPAIYGVLSALPGTGLGDVIYKPLANRARLPESAWGQVATAFELYRQEASYRRDIWAAALEEWSRLGVVALGSPDSPLPAEPLRLALLAPDRGARDELVNDFNRNGLGASRFYGSDLTGVAGIPEMVKRQGPFPNARALADRFFTLPTHDSVTAATVRRARDLVLSWHRSRYNADRI